MRSVIRHASRRLELYIPRNVDVYNDKNRLVGTVAINQLRNSRSRFNHVVIFLPPLLSSFPSIDPPSLNIEQKKKQTQDNEPFHSIQQLFAKIRASFKTILAFDVYRFELHLPVHLRRTSSVNELIDLKLLKQTINSAVWFVWCGVSVNAINFLNELKKNGVHGCGLMERYNLIITVHQK